MKKSSWKEDVSASLRRGKEKVVSPEYELLKMVVILVEYGSQSGRVVLRGQVRRCSCRQSDWCEGFGHGR